MAKFMDIKLAIHGSLIYFDHDGAIVGDLAFPGIRAIGIPNAERFLEAVGLYLVVFDKVF
jgi:hypothetical protein